MVMMDTTWEVVNSNGQIKVFFADRTLKSLFGFSDIFTAMRPAPDGIQTFSCLFLEQPAGGHTRLTDLVLLI